MKQVAFKRSVFVWLRAVMLVTAAVVFYIVGPARPVQAVQDPVCDPSLKWSCVAGTAQNKVYNSGSRCWTWQCVWGYSVNCTQCSGCGNDKIDPGEDCDGLNLNNKTCRDLGYDGGALSCFPESCNFDESRCTKAARCGNNQLDSGEQCDGSILNNPQYDTNKDNRVDCRDFGFTSGVLSCSGCNFNTDQCGRCGNGILEAGEECDGFNFGNQTCQTAGCQAGRLLCGLTCKVDKSQCTGCVGQCQTTTMSVWSAPNNFNKSCCGSANGQFFTDLNSKSPNLCSGSQSAALFGEYDADGALLTNNSKKELAAWAWKCVNDSCDQNCLAYKKAECAVEVSSAGDSCEPGKIFNNFVSYQTALCKRVGTGSNQSKEWIEKCAKYGVPAGWQGSDRDNSPACAGGKQIANSVCRPLGSSWLNQNQEWTCAGTGPQGVKNEARCSVGWRQDSVCGSANGQDYKTGKGYCRDDAAWKEFFGLSNRADNDVKLCGSGSKVYLPNTFKRYWMAPWGVFEPTETSEYDGFDYPWFKYFSWQCRYDVTSNSRKGEPVNCRARLLDTNCDGDNAICGPAVNKKFPYFSQGPTTGFCQTGKLGGSIGSKVKFSQDTHTWSWTCLSASGESRVAKCSVQATVFCGAAMTSGKEYTTFDAVKKAGACGGANGVLVDNTIEDKGVAWQWACADKTDDTVYTLCQAPTGRCGHAGGRTFLESTFDGNKSNNGFLCPAGVTAGNLSGPDYNASFKVNQWNWSCGQTVCSARQLACGQAGAENYFRAMFEKQVAATPTFLCSSSFGAVNLSYQDNLDKGTAMPWLFGLGTASAMTAIRLRIVPLAVTLAVGLTAARWRNFMINIGLRHPPWAAVGWVRVPTVNFAPMTPSAVIWRPRRPAPPGPAPIRITPPNTKCAAPTL